MKRYLFIWLLLLYITSTFAQQSLSTIPSRIISPSINSDCSVTFSLYMPNAKQVSIKGDWLINGSASMQLTNGIWSYQTSTLLPDVYIYTFNVDGVDLIDPSNVYQIRDASTLYSIFMIEGTSHMYGVKDISHGTVSHRWYPSPTLNKQRRLSIYTPPGYESSKKKYPVLYLLHGMGGDEEAWLNLGRVSQILDNLIESGKASPMIVVMSNGNVVQQATPGQDSKGFYMPSFLLPHTMDGEFESSFNDILAFIESNYNVKKNKAGRAIAGLSMGGYHSLYISANNPELFDYIGLFSPAIYPDKGIASTIYEKMDEKLMQQAKQGYKLYWIGIGKDDFLYNDVAKQRNQMNALHMPYIYRETDKGHVWTNWRNYLSEFVTLIFK